MTYRTCGNSGLKLPVVSLGLWQGFGDGTDPAVKDGILDAAVAAGITHIDLANNYGPPPGAAERYFGGWLARQDPGLRDQLIISTKAGYTMWPGPYGDGGSRKYLLASLDQSLARLGLEYVDLFYSHRFDIETPLDETVGALATAVDSGRALYVGISSYAAERTREAVAAAAYHRVPITIHQPSYSIVNRWIEKPDSRTADAASLLDVIEQTGMGCIVFSPLAQGLLTDKYLDGIPAHSRAARNDSFRTSFVSAAVMEHVRALNDLAARRGQSLAQLALTWARRDSRVTSLLIGASSVDQLKSNLDALQADPLSADELAEIDAHAIDAGVNIWAARSSNW